MAFATLHVSYGLGGTTPVTASIQLFSPVAEQSIHTLVTDNGLLVGGTSIWGGGGSYPTQTEAKLFIWDPVSHQTVYETVPVSNAERIFSLITAQNGLIYGVADGGFFVFDPQERRVVTTAPLPFPRAILNSNLELDPSGRIWGVATTGVYTIDPQTNTSELIDQSPELITAGIALDGWFLYYASGPTIYRYQIPP